MPTLAALIVRSASVLVPSDIRADWRREWETELGAAFGRRDGSRQEAGQLRRALGAWPHALWLRADRWRPEMIWQDVRHGARSLAARPGFALIAILSLALGIGANVAIYSAVRAVLLRPLPFPEPERLVKLVSSKIGQPRAVSGAVSPPDFVDWRRDATSFADMAAFNDVSLAITGDGPAEQLSGTAVTGGFFAILDVRPLYGRVLTWSDDTDMGKVIVLGHDLWRRRYGGDPSVVGRTLLIDGVVTRVVGIMPASFSYPLQSDVWVPLRFTERDITTQRGAHYLDIVARLKPGAPAEVAAASAAAEMATIAARLAAAYPSQNSERTVTITPIRDSIVGDVRKPLWMLLGAVGVVLLIVCANVANLALTRALGRQREFAIRTALGASRGRLARGLVVESLLLCAAGGAAGLLLAGWITGALTSIDSLDIPLLRTARIDGSVLLFAFAMSAAAALICGTLPGWQASSRVDLAKRMREDGGNTTSDPEKQRVRSLLIVAETALAVVLLIGAGLLMRSFLGLASVSLGFEPDRVQTFSVSLPAASYPSPDSQSAFVDTLLTRIAAHPDVESAGAVFGLSLTDFRYTISTSTMDGRRLTDEEQDGKSVQLRVVTPGFFRTMGIPINRGRPIVETDRPGAPLVAVINEAAAKLYWPSENAIGHAFELGTRMVRGGPRAGGAVVGIASDIHDFGPAIAVKPTVYIAHAQFPTDFMSVVIKGRPSTSLRAGGALVEPMRRLLADLDPNVPMYQVKTMERLSADAVAQPKLFLTLLAFFAATAILLAAIGIYGVLAHSVGQRTREIGLRLALGADRAKVMTMVVGQAMRLAIVGLAIGLALAMGVGRWMQGLLFGVNPLDGVTYGLVAGGLVVVAFVASWLPARRASRVDPLTALRAD
jgi:putative ABC transport system permease protein